MKKKYIKNYIVVICIVTLLVIGGTYFTFKINGNNFQLISSNNGTNSVMLNYTNSVDVSSDGVYITDVSEVVDEVMPSIVAITSKTVISSGKYGPSFFGNGSYTTDGAGSGVIVSENDNEIFVLTNYHVVEDSTELSVQFINDKSYDATVKGVSERNYSTIRRR